MKVILLTSGRRGSASFHLKKIAGLPHIEVVMVLLSMGTILNKKKYYLSKLKKLLRIGLPGTINGIRMRKWYGDDLEKHLATENIDELCKRYKIPFHTTPTINCAETERLFALAQADVGLSIGNGYIGSKIFLLPKFGMLNIHHEILPDYQNAQSIIWQLYNGSAETGYTIHKIDKKIDTGEILYQEKFPIQFRDSLKDTVICTLAGLYEKSSQGLAFVLQNFNELYSKSLPQGKGKSYTTPGIRQFIRIKRNYKKLLKKQNLQLPFE